MYNFELEREKAKHKFYGMYRAVVVDNLDPMSKGRIKVLVPSVYEGVSTEALPWAHYADPFMGGSPGVGGMFVPDMGTHVWVFFENGDHMSPVYFAGSPGGPHFPDVTGSDTPDSENREPPIYPENRVFATKAGHTIEIDDTPSNPRVRVKHSTGTQVVMFGNGDLYEECSGDVIRVYHGDVHEIVNGNYTTQTTGNREIYTEGDTKYQAYGEVDIIGDTIHLNKHSPSFDYLSPYQFDTINQTGGYLANATPLIDITSTNGPFDEPLQQKELIEAVIDGKVDNPDAQESTTTPTVIPLEEGSDDYSEGNTSAYTKGDDIDYGLLLSPNVTLADVSTNAVFPHRIQAQCGFTVEEIINQNLSALAANIIEPIIAQFPIGRFNSGFRTVTNGQSQHEFGMAIDFQWSGKSASFYTDVCKWIVKNVNYDTLGLEHGNSPWIHITFDPRNGIHQRKRVFTYYPKTFPNYKFGTLINYYHEQEVIV